MAERQKEWQNGRMAEMNTYILFMVHADTNDTDDTDNTYFFYSIDNLLIFRTEVSCFYVTLLYSTLFCCGGKANLVQFTLFCSTLLTLTDGMTDGETNTLTLRGLEKPAHALRGLEEPFFQL
jgi:hypothetical protein